MDRKSEQLHNAADSFFLEFKECCNLVKERKNIGFSYKTESTYWIVDGPA